MLPAFGRFRFSFAPRGRFRVMCPVGASCGSLPLGPVPGPLLSRSPSSLLLAVTQRLRALRVLPPSRRLVASRCPVACPFVSVAQCWCICHQFPAICSNFRQFAVIYMSFQYLFAKFLPLSWGVVLPPVDSARLLGACSTQIVQQLFVAVLSSSFILSCLFWCRHFW